jgi:hypothetical protein
MNLPYLRQCIEELRKCKDGANRTTRSKEQAYLEKCREFVEILIDSDILYEFAESIVDSNSNSSDMSIDEPTPSNTSNIQHDDVDGIDAKDTDILNQYHVDCNNYYVSILTQYQTDSNNYYTQIFDKYRVDSYEYYSAMCNQYQVDSEKYYAELLNQYQANSEAYYTSILNQYQSENEKYYTEYNIWYEKELNEYYTDCYTEYYTECLQKLCWQYYTSVENNQITLNQELVIKNRDLVAHNKILQEFETKYNSLLSQNKNNTLLLNSMKNEYGDIYRRLLIMISQYNKLYIDFEKYKKNIQNANNSNDTYDIDDTDNDPIEKMNNILDILDIPDDYDYIDTEQYDNSSKE